MLADIYFCLVFLMADLLCWLISVVELTTVTDGDGDGAVRSDYDGGLKNRFLRMTQGMTKVDGECVIC